MIQGPDSARATPEGRAWLQRLPALMGECAEMWGLSIGEPFPLAAASLALAVTTQKGESAVLKLCSPHRESEHEADALRLWNGDGAVRLLAHDPERWALLIERCLPGTQLADCPPEEGLDVLIGLLPRLSVAAAEPFRPLADEAAWWVSYLPDRWELAGRPFERSLLDAACEALRYLPPTQSEHVLLHQDLHPGNVLRAEREPWLVIDPKPLAGEREFAVAPIVRAVELRTHGGGHPVSLQPAHRSTRSRPRARQAMDARTDHRRVLRRRVPSGSRRDGTLAARSVN